jgi:hypothetical protein
VCPEKGEALIGRTARIWGERGPEKASDVQDRNWPAALADEKRGNVISDLFSSNTRGNANESQPAVPIPMSQVYTDFPQPHWDYNHHPGLSLNISCLSVASPPNPATPISPATNPFSQPQFQFDPHHGSPSQQSPSTAYDEQGLAPPGSAAASYDRRSRSSSSSSQLPRKRSFPSLPEESSAFDDAASRETPMDLASYDDMDMRTAYGSSTNGGGSPIEGSGNNSGAEDALNGSGSAQLSMALGAVGGTMNVLGKPIATNNFVTKLYQYAPGGLSLSLHLTLTLARQDDQRPQVGSLYRLDRAWDILCRVQCRRVQPKHPRLAFQAQQRKSLFPALPAKSNR